MNRASHVLVLAGVLVTVAHAGPALALGPSYVQAWVESGTVGDGWGDAISTAGDVNGDGYSDVLVGAPYFTGGQQTEGIVYLYYGGPGGLEDTPGWSYQSNVTFAQFGRAVAPAGDTNGDGYGDFLVGAPELSNGHTGEGRVYLFAGGPSSPSLLQTFEINEAGARFGHSVAWAGDVNGDGYDDVLAGAPEWGGFGSPFYIPVQGAVRLYHGGPGGPDTGADWSRSGGQENADFGFAVAGVGDMNGDGFADVMVGSPQYDPGTLDTNYGAVFLYQGSATGLSSSPIWTRVGAGSGDQFGWAIAFAGDVDADGRADALVGAPTYAPTAGAFYRCRGVASGDPVLTIHVGTHPGFGGKLCSVGDVNTDGFADVIAAGGSNNTAWVYFGSGGGLGNATGFGFGSYDVVAGAGDVNGDGGGDFLVCDTFALNGAGVLAAYHGCHSLNAAPAQFTLHAEGNEDGDRLGADVSRAGDVNGDGIEDLIVGIPQGGGPNDYGAIELYDGRWYGINTGPDQSLIGWTPAGRFGEAVAAAGDVNGDGYDDVVVGEPGGDRVHVIHGSAEGLQGFAAWSYQFAVAGADFGAAVGGAGDINGDGYADIIVGGPLYDGDDTDQGIACIFYGSPAGITSDDAQSVTWNEEGMRLGAAVTVMGDANGDGYDEVAMGAPGYDWGGLADRGQVLIYRGGPQGIFGAPYGASGSVAGSAMGSAVAGAGDLNRDGLADLVAGAPLYTNGAPAVGRVLILLGSSTSGVLFDSWHYIESPSTLGGESFGRSVDTLGDIETGKSAIVVGSQNPATGTAQAQVFRMIGTSIDQVASVSTAETGTGSVVASAGDVNGDGFADFAIGSPQASNARGKVWLFGPVKERAPNIPRINLRLHRAGGEPVALRGRVEESTDLQVSAEGWLPVGRAPLRLEWKLAEMGQGFADGSAGAWNAVREPSGVTLLSADLDLGLDSPGRYRWRARVASRNPYLPAGPWLTRQPNGNSLYGFALFNSQTGVAETNPGAGARLLLAPPEPNPMGRETRLRFILERRSPVDFRIVDTAGRLVRTLHAGEMEAGPRELRWNARDDAGREVASGIYHAILDTGDGVRHVRKITVLR